MDNLFDCILITASANKCPESGPKPILLAPRKSWIKSDVLQDVKEAPPADENKVISKPPPGCVPQRYILLFDLFCTIK